MGEAFAAGTHGRGICISYVPSKQSSIDNSNMLGAALLARRAVYTKDHQALELAKSHDL